MYNMFQEFGFDVDIEELRKLFSIIKLQKKGNMDLEEFKSFMMDQTAAVCKKGCLRVNCGCRVQEDYEAVEEKRKEEDGRRQEEVHTNELQFHA